MMPQHATDLGSERSAVRLSPEIGLAVLQGRRPHVPWQVKVPEVFHFGSRFEHKLHAEVEVFDSTKRTPVLIGSILLDLKSMNVGRCALDPGRRHRFAAGTAAPLPC